MLILNDWFTTFVRLLIWPKAEMFQEEAQKAKDKFWSSMAWLVFVVLVTHVYFILAARFFYPIGIILLTLFLFPFGVLLFVLGVHRLTQKWFQVQEDHYFEILYLTTAAIVPCFLLNFAVGLIPGVGGVLSYVVIFYPLILVSLAIKALMPLTVWQVLAVVLVSLLFAVAGMFVIPYFLAGVISNLGAVLPV